MNKLREIRIVLGYNQREVSEASHTGQGNICAIEAGRLKPWPAVAKRLSEALGVPIEKLFPEEAAGLLKALEAGKNEK